MNNNLKKIFLLGGDIFILYFSLYLALIIRYFNEYSEGVWLSHFWPFTGIFILWLIILDKKVKRKKSGNSPLGAHNPKHRIKELRIALYELRVISYVL